jgi:hypothetical protein
MEDANQWCDENGFHPVTKENVYYFPSSGEAVAFRLRWG